MRALYIALQYLRFSRWRTATLVVCIAVIVSLPILSHLVVREANTQLRARAVATPLLVGAPGSSMDLVLSSLYFTDDLSALTTMETLNALTESGLVQSIPLLRRFRAGEYPIVGTSLDYFPFRDLSLARGRPFLYLGECVLGAAVAEQLKLEPGDSLLSSSENVFDLAGDYPLKMTVSGILGAAGTADDMAVFVDVKTSWVLAGLGHGHENLEAARDPDVILQRDQRGIQASAKLLQYTEITPENRDSFHFHGDAGGYPLSAIIASPFDARSEALFKGRFIDTETAQRIVDPQTVVEQLLERIFQVKKVVDGITALIAAVTLLALMLVFALSMRLRESEFQTLFKLGCGRRTITCLLAAEILLVLAASLALSGSLLALAYPFFDSFTRWLIFR